MKELAFRKHQNPIEFFEPLPQQQAFNNDLAKVKGLFGGNRQLEVYGTKLVMANGIRKRLADIVIGDMVLAWDGKEAVPTTVIDIPYDDYNETIKVITGSGLEVEGDKTHCFPIEYEKCDKRVIKRMTLLEAGSKKYKNKHFVCSGVQQYTNKQELPFSGLLLGLYLGDGSSSKSPSNGYNNCNFTNTEEWIRDLFRDGVKDSFAELQCKAYPSDTTRLYVKGVKKNGNGFLNSLKKLNLAGKKSDTKFIPDVFKYHSVKTRREILRGLILTDGGTDKYKTTIWSNSLQMLKDVEEIIISLGGRSKIYKDGEPANENQHQQYKLQFSNLFLGIMKIEGLGRKTPTHKSIRKPRRDDLKIKTMISTGVKRCRCLTVEHESHTFVLANGIVTYNSGKTEDGAFYVVNKCLAAPKQRWWVVAKNFSDSVNVQQRKIWALLPKGEIKYGDYSEVNGFTNKKLIFKNGSIMLFKSYDQKREAFQSDDIDGIWNDEEPPYDIYREERMRLIDRDGEMIFTMTSVKGITQLLEEIFDGHEVINTRYAPLVKEHIPTVIAKDGMKFYMLWTTDNPYVNANRTLQETKLMTRDEIKARIYGLPVNLKGRVYPKFSRDVHVIKFEDIPFHDCSFITVMDPHDRKPYAIIYAAVDSMDRVYIFHESPFEKDFNDMAYGDKTYDEYAAEIKEIDAQIRKLGGTNFIDRIIDPNFGNSTIKLATRQGGQSKTTVKQEFAKRGLRFRDGIDLLEEGHLKVREYLHYEDKFNDAAEREIIVHPKLFIAERCINTISHISKYAHKDPETAGGDVKNHVGLVEKYKDFSDCTRYLLMSNPRKKTNRRFEPNERKAY